MSGIVQTGRIDPELPVPSRAAPDEPPPILGQWSRVYLAIILYLVCLLFVLFLITRAFRY